MIPIQDTIQRYYFLSAGCAVAFFVTLFITVFYYIKQDMKGSIRFLKYSKVKKGIQDSKGKKKDLKERSKIETQSRKKADFVITRKVLLIHTDEKMEGGKE